MLGHYEDIIALCGCVTFLLLLLMLLGVLNGGNECVRIVVLDIRETEQLLRRSMGCAVERTRRSQ